MVAFSRRGPSVLFFSADSAFTEAEIKAIEGLDGCNVQYRNGSMDVPDEHLEVADAVAGPAIPKRYQDAYKTVTSYDGAVAERDRHLKEIQAAAEKDQLPTGMGPLAMKDIGAEAKADAAKEDAKARGDAEKAREKAAAEWAKNKPKSTTPAQEGKAVGK